jgi:oligoribonuclease (3'-5' exoribonuclease)
MKFASLDIETTGLSRTDDDILEIAVAIFDAESENPMIPVDTFRRAIYHERVEGSPYAMQLNADLLHEIAEGGDEVVNLDIAFGDLELFLQGHLVDKRITVAGKNVDSFDLAFMTIAGFPRDKYFPHRVLDPASIYARVGDKRPPGLAKCIERSGVNPVVWVEHNGLSDAIITGQTIMAHLLREGS